MLLLLLFIETPLPLEFRYMKQLCTQLDKSNMYGFIDPNFIQPQNDRVGSQSYITEKLVENEKDCFFVPYLNK
jgi:hypothetical protein